MRGGADPRRPMDIRADVSGSYSGRFSGVQPHAYTDANAIRPGMVIEGTLSIEHGGDGVFGRIKCDEERITLCVDLTPAPPGEGVAKELSVLGQDLCIAITELA